MSANPNLVALLNAINTNSLTVGMQGALAQALALIIPNFPTPDELSSALPPPDEDDAREWIAALYSIQATGGGGGGSVVNAAFTPNTETSFGPITPGGSPVDLAVADITPTGTGLLQIVATFAFATSVPDAANLALFAVAPLTSIVGGTLVGNGITADPTSTAPAPSGTPIMSVVAVESTVGGDLASMTITGTYQAVPGQRTGIVVQGLSAVGGGTTWVVGFTMSVVELAAGGVGGGSVTNVSAAANSGLTVANPTTTPVVGPQPGFSPASLTFLNNAALAAFSAATPTALVQGQRAVVLSNGGVWTFKLVSALTPGNTVINAAGVAGAQWVRDGQTNVPNALKQTAWFVDAQNVSGTASDENDGLTSATALINKREIYRRWGYTWAPNLVAINVVVTYLSTDVGAPNAGSDPGFFEPFLINGSTFKETAALPPAAFTGTLLAVTAKSVGAGGGALKSTFTTITGAVAADMLLVNTSRGNSRAIASSVSGATWTLSQPLAGPYTTGLPTVTNVDTWANGDAIQGFNLLGIDLGLVGGHCVGVSATLTPGHIVQNLRIVDSSAGVVAFPIDVDPLAFTLFVDCVIVREKRLRQGTPFGTCYFIGCSSHGLSGQGCFEVQKLGGILGNDVSANPNLIDSAFMGNNVLVVGATTFRNGKISLTGNVASQAQVCVDTGGVLTVDGDTTVDGAASCIYGPGTLNARGGGVTHANSAATSLTVATLQLNGVATGYSNATAAGLTTTHGGIALSAANLDAAAGAAGFGGYAFGGGGYYSHAGLQP